MKCISVNLQLNYQDIFLSYRDILHLCGESLKNVNPNPHICEGEIHSLADLCRGSTPQTVRNPTSTRVGILLTTHHCYKVLAFWRMLAGVHHILPDALNLYARAYHTCLQKMHG
jgi:hypothetical protein